MHHISSATTQGHQGSKVWLMHRKKGLRAKISESLFEYACLFATLLPLVILFWLLGDTVVTGLKRIDLDFLTGFPSRFAHKAGILPSIVGTLYLMILTAIISIPLGIAAAIYLEEYAKDTWLTRLIEINVANLAGVPSVIFGLLGLEIFVRIFDLGPSILAGALTLSLLILPVIVTASRESFKLIPYTLREAGLALGATKLAVIVKVVLPLAMSQIITGSILALSRCIGETAPIIVIGAASYIAFIPQNVGDEFSVLPIQIFQWMERPQSAFIDNASAAILVLLFFLVILNGAATLVRERQEQKEGSR